MSRSSRIQTTGATSRNSNKVLPKICMWMTLEKLGSCEGICQNGNNLYLALCDFSSTACFKSRDYWYNNEGNCTRSEPSRWLRDLSVVPLWSDRYRSRPWFAKFVPASWAQISALALSVARFCFQIAKQVDITSIMQVLEQSQRCYIWYW